MEIIDNINQLLGDSLKRTIGPNSKLKIAASCFSIYAYEALKEELAKIDSMEFIFTSPAFIPDQVTDKLKKEKREFHIPKLKRENSLYGSEFEIRLKNELTQKAIAKECADWVRAKVEFKSNRANSPMQQFACVDDSPANVHDINVLTVVASESYKDFVGALQKEISESLSTRPHKANEAYFTGKILKMPDGDVTVTEKMAKQIYRYLLKNDYTDDNDAVTSTYNDDKKDEKLASLPHELTPYASQVFQLIDSVFSDVNMPEICDGRKTKTNPLNKNFERAEFKALWDKINRKAAYTVHFDSNELIIKCKDALNEKLQVTKLQYTIQRGAQKERVDYESLQKGDGFELHENQTDFFSNSVHSAVQYDLIGKLTEDTKLTRRTIASILSKVKNETFDQFRVNPEDFILKTGTLINEQKATVIIEELVYDPVEDKHDLNIFTAQKPRDDFSKAVKTERHVYDYVFTDSRNEKDFVKELDKSVEVVVYAKLPSSFFIPTPVGNYNPDWAIAFKEGAVKHVYFVAETKGSMSSMDLRKIEETKIECARRFFTGITSGQVKYDVVDSYEKLMNLVK
jgi:type III restriction enzyme